MKTNRPTSFKLQQDQYDCGVTCLRNILGYYHADISLEKLREWSGAGIQGTSLLGLHQAASQAGFTAEGARAGDISDLQEVQHPCILHVSLDGSLLHYVVYYPQQSSNRPATATDRFLIGDPAKGLVWLDPEELEKIWTSHNLQIGRAHV